MLEIIVSIVPLIEGPHATYLVVDILFNLWSKSRTLCYPILSSFAANENKNRKIIMKWLGALTNQNVTNDK